MIKYRDQDYQEYLNERQTVWYPKGVLINNYSVSNLRIYMKWLVELFESTFGRMPAKILEPGCRLGETGEALRQLYGDKVAFRGIEISPTLISASNNLHGLISYGDICSCPEIDTGSFDIVFSRTLLSFLKDIPSALVEMLRITATPGFVVIVQPVPYSIGVYHYNSMDSFDDLREWLKGYEHKTLESIPPFGEPILIVEK